MAITLHLVDASETPREITANRVPDWCPRCERYGAVKILAAVQTGSSLRPRRDVVAICECSDLGCEAVFVVFYALIVENGIETARLMSHRPLEYTAPSTFSEAILNLSPTFCETYDQAARAEENGLAQICGAGYRRALEFLVKDFAIAKLPSSEQEQRQRIARTFLGQCIRDYLPNPIQDAAKRAAWLGNDEIHYYRTWSDRDVSDLKALIHLTVKSIDFTLELDHYISTMPDERR